MSVARKLIVIAVTVAILLGLNQIFEYGFGNFQINPYYARIVNLIGINITLAVSLNLINGLAGQFSIGHAGFMAVGGYTATYLTVNYGQADRSRGRQHARRRRRRLGRHGAEPARRRVRGGARRTRRRHSFAASQGRLSRDRDAGVRRDHPRRHPEHPRGRRRDRIHRRDPDHELLLDFRDGDH